MSTADQVLAALQSYKLKDKGSGKWRCNSPLRQGSDSESFSLTIHGDGEHGSYFDHVSEESGSLYELAKKLGIELPERTQIEDTKRTYTGLADYAAAHGVAPEVYTRAGWSETKKDRRLALAIKTQTGVRYRFLDGEKPVYKSPPEYKRCWYGLNVPTIERVSKGQKLVLCNGEASTVVAHHFGLAACCITAGEHQIPPELFEDLKSTLGMAVEIVVALDCDEKGLKTARQIEQQLRRAGFSARAVNLGLSRGGDLADFCMLHGQSTPETLERCPSLPSSSKGRIYRLTELGELPDPRWLLDGEIPEQGLVVFCGKSGVGKSFVALDRALQISLRKVVFYVALEGKSGIKKRAWAWCKHNKVDRKDAFIHFRFDALSLVDKPLFDEFMQQIREIKPSMVVIDTLSRAIGVGDPNTPRDMNLFVAACVEIQEATQGVVVIIHHARKNDSTYSGSAVLFNSSETFINVRNSDGLLYLECEKMKDSDPFAPRYLRFVHVEMDDGKTTPVVIPAEKYRQMADDPLSQTQYKIIETILDYFPNGAPCNDLAEVCEVSRGLLLRNLSVLQRLGYVHQPRKRAPYSVTIAGETKTGLISAGFHTKTHQDSDQDSLSDRSNSSDIQPRIGKTQKTHRSGKNRSSGPQGPILVSPESSEVESELPEKTDGVSEQSESSVSPGESSESGSTIPNCPDYPCPRCGSNDWNLHPVSKKWYCYSCDVGSSGQSFLIPPPVEYE